MPGYGSCTCCGACDAASFSGFAPKGYVAHPLSGGDPPTFRWLTSQIVLDGAGAATPGGTYLKRVRRTGPNFEIRASITPFEVNGSIGDIAPTQTGIAIANAYALWIDWGAKTLVYAATDSIGQIIGAGTVIHTYSGSLTGAIPVIQAWRLSDGTYNVFFGDVGNGIGGVIAGVWGVSPAGLLTTSAKVGLTANPGGGAWGEFVSTCSPRSDCCPHGVSFQFDLDATVTGLTPSSGYSIVNSSVGIDATGCCLWVSPAVSFAPAVPVNPDFMLPLSSTSEGNWLLFFDSNDDVRMVFQYAIQEIRSGGQLSAAAAIYSIPKENFLCFCDVELTLETSPTGYTFCGFSRPYYPLTGLTFPGTINLTAHVGGATLPCGTACEWVSIKTLGVLSWQRVTANCPTGQSCVNPAFAPSYEGQTCTTGCA